MNVWVDANVLLRFIMRDVPEQARRARRLMRRAEDGELVLRVPGVVIAEVVWVLSSFYEVELVQIAETLRALVSADGIAVDDADVVLEALRIMERANVAYVDAFLAAVTRQRNEPVATFDRDFRRLGVELFDTPAG